MSNSSIHSASCLCGAIKFDIAGDPLTFMVCHCINCHKATGSVFMSNTFFKQKVRPNLIAPWRGAQTNVLWKNVHIKQGKDQIKGYEDKATKSGRILLRSFCALCGSNVFLGTPGSDIIGIPVGVVDHGARDWGGHPLFRFQLLLSLTSDVAISPRTVPRKEIFKHDRMPWINEITTQAKSKL